MGWGNALAAAVGGYLKGTNIVEDQQDRKDEKEWRDERRARVRKDEAKQDSLDRDLQTAGATVGVTEGAGGMVKPDTMDNRDVGLPENAALPNQGLQEGGFSVAGKAFGDRAAADAAAAAENSPDAVNARVSGAYRRAGQFDKAMAMEQGAIQTKAAKLQLDEATERKMNEAFDRRLLTITTPEALAQTLSGSPVVGGAQVTPVLAADGKTFQLATTGPDGKQVMVGDVMPADTKGLQSSVTKFAQSMNTVQRLTFLQHEHTREQAQANSDRAFKQQADQFNQSFGLQSRSADRQDKLADMQIKTQDLVYQEALRGAKIPQGVKMQVESLREQAKTINTAIVNAQAAGTWDLNNPNSKSLLQQQAIVTARIGKYLEPYIKETGAADPFNLKPQGRNAGANGGQGGGAGRGSVPASYKDPVWDSAESEASKKTGVPTEILRIIRTVGERSNSDQVSPKGAKGVYQFIPSTRDAFQKKYGVDAYSDDPYEQALAAAYHLKESYDRTGDWKKAAAGYNGGVSGEKGTNRTAENKAYAARTGAALGATQGANNPFAGRVSEWAKTEFAQPRPPMAAPVETPFREQPQIDYSGIRGADANRRPGEDPMAAIYRKQVEEMNRGMRAELSPDVAAWKQRMDAGEQRAGEQRFNAAQAASLQQEKLRAQRKSSAAS